MLEKISVIDKIEVLELGQIQVRRADKILENGKEISKTYHRHVLVPGDDLTGQNKRVIAIANVTWTTEVITTYQKILAESI